MNPIKILKFAFSKSDNAQKNKKILKITISIITLSTIPFLIGHTTTKLICHKYPELEIVEVKIPTPQSTKEEPLYTYEAGSIYDMTTKYQILFSITKYLTGMWMIIVSQIIAAPFYNIYLKYKKEYLEKVENKQIVEKQKINKKLQREIQTLLIADIPMPNKEEKNSLWKKMTQKIRKTD